MSGIFSTLNTANKGLQAQQAALHTVSHNISNANTEGYSRQRVDLKADLAFTLGGVGQLGTGVKMTGIVRLVDDYVTKQIRQENGTLSKFSVKSEVLEQLEIIYNEPSDTSLNFNMGEMFDAWTELSKNPEMLTAKSIVVEKSKTMTNTLNHIANQLEGLKSDTVELIGSNVKKFNSIVGSLDALNKQIFNIGIKGQVPNDLLDQRDLMLKDLSSVTDFTTSFDENGRVGIKVETGIPATDTTVLSFDGSTKLEMNSDIGVITLEDDNTPPTSVSFSPKTGEIAGYKDVLAEIDAQIAELDKFAVTMANAINKVHKEGMGGGLENDFFRLDDGSAITAANIKVNKVLQDNNSLVNAGKTSTSAVGDGERALAISSVRNAKLGGAFNFDTTTMKWTDDPNGNTIESAYNGMVTNVGISKQQSDNMVANQEVLLDQLVLRRESTSGVSIDEEVTNMIKFQKSFEANARVIQVLSEMLDTLINRTGV